MYKIKFIFMVLIIFIFTNTLLLGQLMRNVEEKDIVKNSSHIIVGTVTKLECFEMKKNGRIYTNVFIKPENTIKGKVNSKEFILCNPGGTIGEITMELVGAPVYSVAEKVLVFCKPWEWKEGSYINYASWLGKKTIKDNIVIEERVPLSEYINKIKSYK